MTKHRFVFLDGMRGVAAFAVVCLHAGIGFNLNWLAWHGYLAVDFFFCLSGFVVAYAYEERIKSGMRFSTFAALRLIRLYPMIFAAAVLAPLVYFWGASWVDMPEITVLSFSGFVLLPLGFFYRLAAFPLNGPIWSLFFEFFANALYFFEVRQPSPGRLLSGVFLLCVGVSLALIVHRAGSADAIGFASPLSFAAGFNRVVYSFFAGVIIHRFELYAKLQHLPDWVLAVLLAALLYAPATQFTWIYDSVGILLLFPLLVALGAQVTGTGLLTGFWCFCGRLSYPLYVIHEPVLRAVHRICGMAVQQYPGSCAAASIAAALLVSAGLMFFYDEPLRGWLGGRREKSGVRKGKRSLF